MNLTKFKRGVLLSACFVSTIVGISSVSALTINSDGSYTTNRGATISREDYNKISSNYRDVLLDKFNQEAIDFLIKNPNTEEIAYSITTEKIDRMGNVVSSVTIPATKEEAEAVKTNENLHALGDGKLHDIAKENPISTFGYVDAFVYQTASKRLRFQYFNNQIWIDCDWLKTPNIKSYDVLAVRWTKNISRSNLTYFEASQLSDAGTTKYDGNNGNLKFAANGIGQSMNLYDKGTTFYLAMALEFDQLVGDYAYGTYQHATTNVSLATSKSYTFGNGYGGVIVFNNGVGSYYDNMQGLRRSWQDGKGWN